MRHSNRGALHDRVRFLRGQFLQDGDHYGWLTKPRAEMKRKMAKGVGKN
jgi:hypothetical protein